MRWKPTSTQDSSMKMGGNYYGFCSWTWVIIDRLRKSAHFLPICTTYTVDKYTELYIKEIVRLHGVPSSMILLVIMHPNNHAELINYAA